MVHDLITGFIFVLGLATVFLSLYACVKFNRFRRGLSSSAASLSGAVSWQLAGEAVIGLGTLLFATAQFVGWLANWSYYFTSFLRFVMFTATSITTFHLVRTISRLSDD